MKVLDKIKAFFKRRKPEAEAAEKKPPEVAEKTPGEGGKQSGTA